MSNALKSQGTKLEVQTGGATPTFIEVSEVTTMSDIDSGQAADIDVTHLQSTAREYRIGLKESGPVTLEGNLVPTDAGQAELRAARDDQAERQFKITLTDLPTPTTLEFVAFVKQFGTSAAVDSKMPFNSVLRVTSDVAWTVAP